MLKKILIGLLLIVLFFISVNVRNSNMNRMLSEHHEWLTAHVMVTWSIWDKNGFETFNGQPVFSFQNKGDKGNSHDIFLEGTTDNKGNGYYISYPPLAFQFPYLIFKLLHISASVKNLQFFSLLFHFLGAVILFIFIRHICSDYNNFNLLPPLVAYVVYIFSAGNLWFLSNIWFADMMVLPFMIASLYYGYVYWQTEKTNYLIAFLTAVFFMCLTEWVGYIFCFSFFMAGLFFYSKQKKFWVTIAGLFVVGTIALTLTFIQFLSITNWQELTTVLIARFKLRTFQPIPDIHETVSPINKSESWQLIWGNIKMDYSKMMRWIILITCIGIAFKYNKIKLLAQNKTAIVFISVLMLTLLIFHFLFFSFTANHDFSLLKISILFSIVAAFSCLLLIESNSFISRFIYQPIIITGIIVASYQSVKQYHLINDKISCPPNMYIDIGRKIATMSKPDEAVFVTYRGANTIWLERPQRFYYSQRSLIDINSIEEAKKWMMKNKIPDGIIFIDSCNKISDTIQIKNY